jgi:hypothetical protein
VEVWYDVVRAIGSPIVDGRRMRGYCRAGTSFARGEDEFCFFATYLPYIIDNSLSQQILTLHTLGKSYYATEKLLAM